MQGNKSVCPSDSSRRSAVPRHARSSGLSGVARATVLLYKLTTKVFWDMFFHIAWFSHAISVHSESEQLQVTGDHIFTDG